MNSMASNAEDYEEIRLRILRSTAKIIANAHIEDQIQKGGQTMAKQGRKKKKAEKSRLTINLSVDLIERVKNSVYWTPGLTMSSLSEKALIKAVDSLEKKNGEPFPHRKEELRPGRPVL